MAAILIPAATMTDVPVRMGRGVQAQGSIAHGQHWTSSACWHTRKRASLGGGSFASSQPELRPQYARAGPWYGPESNRLPPAGGQAAAQSLCAYLSLGICWHERLKRTLSFCRPVPTREQVRWREAAFKATRIGDQMLGWNTTKENGEVVIGNYPKYCWPNQHHKRNGL